MKKTTRWVFSPHWGFFHLNWGAFWGFFSRPFLWGFMISSGGDCLGVFSPPRWGGVSPLSGGGVLPVWGFFPPFCQVILKNPQVYRECYCTEAVPLHPPVSQDVLSVCSWYNSGWPGCHAIGGGGGMGHLFVNQKSQYQKTGCFMSICCAVRRTPLGRGGGLAPFPFQVGDRR